MAGKVEREPASGVGGKPYTHDARLASAGKVDSPELDSQLLLPSSSSRSSLYFKGCLAGSSFVGPGRSLVSRACGLSGLVRGGGFSQ